MQGIMQVVIWQQLSSLEQKQVLQRKVVTQDKPLGDLVRGILDDVKIRGDAALYEYAERFDGVQLTNLRVSQTELAAANNLNHAQREAITKAYDNIDHYHRVSAPQEFSYQRNGATLGKIYRAIDKVGLYVPGGTAPLVSTLLMLAVPASIAGCAHKVLLSPPSATGEISPAILFAAQLCGISEIYKVGGAQAIAALAYGTETIPKVYKIFGPGNKYVTAAKMQVAQDPNGASFDLPAGPSEVLIVADHTANPVFVSSDLLAQAEHDPASQVLLVTTSAALAQQVLSEIKRQSAYLARREIIALALGHSSIIIASDLSEALEIANQYAPEHLLLQIDNAQDYLPQIKNAGSVFIGAWTPEAVGDYASGTNHVLPTYGHAKTYSGLDVAAFMKSISYQKFTKEGLSAIGPTVATLADLEGLDAHKNALMVRLNDQGEN